MNFAGCANCFMHGWKQVEDQSSLQRCKKCKVIEYCGRECQAEHWKRIHKKQCRYFADPAKAHKWGHSEDDCAICIESAKVGKAELCRSANPNYECILKEKFPTHMYHPHPFPVTGQPGHTYEKGIIVLWQLLKKFELTHPGVIRNCRGKLVSVFAELKNIRLEIWKIRKISHQSEWRLVDFHPPSLLDLLSTIGGKVGSDDLFQIIQLVGGMLLDVFLSEISQALLNPLADTPADLHTIMSRAMSNSTNFLAMANNVLEALATQVVPYRDLLRVVCGDSQQKRCNFCLEKTTIAGIGGFYEKGSTVFFDCLFMKIYRCGSTNCQMKANSMLQDNLRLQNALLTMLGQRRSTLCDFCLKLSPCKGGGGHRCSKCLTVMYCSTTCRDQDWEIHQEFCKEDAEERKKKFGSSGRRKVARGVLEQLENDIERITLEQLEKGTYVHEDVQGARQFTCEVVSKFKLKDASKKAKK